MTNTVEKPNTTYQCPHCDCYIVIPNNDYYDYMEDEWVPGGYFDGWCNCGRNIYETPETEEVRTEDYFDKATITTYRFDHLGRRYRVEHYSTTDFGTWRAFDVTEEEDAEFSPRQPLFRTLVVKALDHGAPATHQPMKVLRRSRKQEEELALISDM